MSEPEIEALMAGQEDENGSVHYEGESPIPTHPRGLLVFRLSLCSLRRMLLSPAFVKHIMSV